MTNPTYVARQAINRAVRQCYPLEVGLGLETSVLGVQCPAALRLGFSESGVYPGDIAKGLLPDRLLRMDLSLCQAR